MGRLHRQPWNGLVFCGRCTSSTQSLQSASVFTHQQMLQQYLRCATVMRPNLSCACRVVCSTAHGRCCRARAHGSVPARVLGTLVQVAPSCTQQMRSRSMASCGCCMRSTAHPDPLLSALATPCIASRFQIQHRPSAWHRQCPAESGSLSSVCKRCLMCAVASPGGQQDLCDCPLPTTAPVFSSKLRTICYSVAARRATRWQCWLRTRAGWR